MNKAAGMAAGLKLHRNIIDGALTEAADGRVLDCLCPSDGLPFAAIPRSGTADIDAAVRSARAAFETGPWGRMTATERGRILLKLGEAILAHHEELAQLEAMDCGKPLKQARADMTVAARYFEFYGTAADKVHGETIPFLNGYTVAIVRDPHGVTGHIVPWNYPAQIFGRSVAASLACGNTCVVKPAEDACLSLIRITALAQYRDWLRRRSGGGAGQPSRHRFSLVHRIARDGNRDPAGGGPQPYRLHIGAWR
jgi:aldehyde dehydrogenase (NAD+)